MSRPFYKRAYHATVKPALNFVTFSKIRHRNRTVEYNNKATSATSETANLH